MPSLKKTQTTQLSVRLTDARVVARRAQANMLSRIGCLSVAGASIASTKSVFPKVTVVIDSICEDELATEVAGPVRFVADSAQAAVKIVGGKSRGGTR